MPLKQGTETSTRTYAFNRAYDKKDAPKAGDGNLVETVMLSTQFLDIKKMPLKQGTETLRKCLWYASSNTRIKKMPLKQGTETYKRTAKNKHKK